MPGGSAAHTAAKLVPYAGVYKSKAALVEQYLPVSCCFELRLPLMFAGLQTTRPCAAANKDQPQAIFNQRLRDLVVPRRRRTWRL